MQGHVGVIGEADENATLQKYMIVGVPKGMQGGVSQDDYFLDKQGYFNVVDRPSPNLRNPKK